MLPDLVLKSLRVVTGGAVVPASIHVSRGVITSVAGLGDAPEGCPTYDAGNLVIMPGIVDSHVHINEPGRTVVGRLRKRNTRRRRR